MGSSKMKAVISYSAASWLSIDITLRWNGLVDPKIWGEENLKFEKLEKKKYKKFLFKILSFL